MEIPTHRDCDSYLERKEVPVSFEIGFSLGQSWLRSLQMAPLHYISE
jgi:hypothetical protein